MTDIDSKIKAIKEEIRKTPYHKGTEHYIGRLKAKLAKLKQRQAQVKPKGKGKGFALKKSGDATVVLVGPPSVGKSSLLNKLTRAHARVEEWPFTTLEVIPGMLQYKGAHIQILDLPGLVSGTATGKGRGQPTCRLGREVLSVVRVADLLLLMVDVKTKTKIPSLIKELKKFKINLPMLVAINKIDLLAKTPEPKTEDQIYISIQGEIGLDDLREIIWQKLELIRIYLKAKGKKPDFEEPLILKKGAKVAAVVEKTFPEEKEFKQILLWGSSARFPGQPVSLNHQLKDEDILSFI